MLIACSFTAPLLVSDVCYIYVVQGALSFTKPQITLFTHSQPIFMFHHCLFMTYMRAVHKKAVLLLDTFLIIFFYDLTSEYSQEYI